MISFAYHHLALICVLALFVGCNAQQQRNKCDAQLLAGQTYAEVLTQAKRLYQKSGSHENVMRAISDEAVVRYLFCMHTDIDKDLYNATIKGLRFNAISSILDLLQYRDSLVVTRLRNFRHDYFRQRYPGNYFGTENAANLEFEFYARRVMDEFLHHYAKYNKEGKIALAALLHNTLTYPARWDYVPHHMRRELAAHIMNLVPGSVNNATIKPPDDWLPESGLPDLAIDIVSRTGEERYVQDVMHFIRNLARDARERDNGFRALARLNAKGARVEHFLTQVLQSDDFRDNIYSIIDAIGQTASVSLAGHLLPYIGGEDHRLWAVAAHAYWKLPDFEERIAALPRQKQVQILLMAEHKTDTTLSNKSLMNRIQPQDAQVLVNTFDINSYRDFVCVARQSMYLLKHQVNRSTIDAVIHMLDELTSTQEGLRLWLIFGYGVQYLERVSGQQFWNPEYPHGVTGQSEKHRHTLLELQETVQKIHVWWDANKNALPSQLVIGQEEG